MSQGLFQELCDLIHLKAAVRELANASVTASKASRKESLRIAMALSCQVADLCVADDIRRLYGAVTIECAWSDQLE